MSIIGVAVVALECEGKYHCISVPYDKDSTVEDVLEKAAHYLTLSKKN